MVLKAVEIERSTLKAGQYAYLSRRFRLCERLICRAGARKQPVRLRADAAIPRACSPDLNTWGGWNVDTAAIRRLSSVDSNLRNTTAVA